MAAGAAEGSKTSVGRGQVTTLQDSPASVDAGIELGRSVDAEDALAASAAMNSVTGKVGVTRKLDGQGHEASRRWGSPPVPLSWLTVCPPAGNR